MIEHSELKGILVPLIGEERYEHSLRVMETAKNISRAYNYREDKAAVAGILHDCGKINSKTTLLKMIDDFDIILDSVMNCNLELAHGLLGSEICKKYFEIEDVEILYAIRYHTTGRAYMTFLEKIIFISDYIEPARDFPGVDYVRDLAYKDLDEALIYAMDNTIKYVIQKGWLIHPDTIEARNHIIKNRSLDDSVNNRG